MTIRRPSPLTVLTSLLVILLPALAVLQYRWVGQVSDAERTRMQRGVRIGVAQFREAFDDEIERALNSLRADATTVRESAWDRYADRYATWSETADHARIVANVFLVDEDAGTPRLRRWDTTTHSFEPASWPALMLPWRRGFEEALALFAPTRPPARIAFPEDDALLVVPVLNPPPRPRERPSPITSVFGFTVLQLDLAYIRDQLLPALVQQHFVLPDGERYRVAILRTATGEVLYRSDPGAPTDMSDADEAVALYDVGGDQRFPTRRQDGARGQRARRGADGRWTLLVQHERGSLDAAVAAVRRRNLGISFGILSLLAGSIGVLAASSRRAERLARQQMEFVAGVSHELRTPVAVIRSAAENLAHGVVGSGDRVKQYGEMIETEARRLGEMVERVLQYAGMDSGRALRAAPLSAPALIESALDAATAADGAVNVQRAIEPDLPLVMGDERALRSALQNLVANAVKYGGPDGWVGIRAQRVAHGRRDEVHITIDDRGPGIPAHDLPHIFEPFYRGHDAIARQVHGSGLGLALVRQIVAAHDGHISVTTRPGGGSSFTIALPAGDPDPREIAAARDASSAAPDAAQS